MCHPGRSEKNLSSYWLKSIESCSSYIKDEKENVAIMFSPAQSPVCFDIKNVTMKMAEDKGSQSSTDIITEYSGSRDEDIWLLVGHSGITREAADAAVTKILPGFLFGWKEEMALSGVTASGVRSCADPALTLGLLARVTDGFYQAERTPDYSIGHLLDTVFTCCDERIPAHLDRTKTEAES